MSLEQDIILLSDVELFSDFNADQLRLMVFGSEKLNFPEGTQIFHEDQASDGGYVIAEGSVELWIDRNGYRDVLEVCERGDTLGEMAMLTQTRRVASAMTLTATSLIRISRATMTRVLEQYPELAAKLYNRIGSNVIDFAKDLDPIAKKMAAKNSIKDP